MVKKQSLTIIVGNEKISNQQFIQLPLPGFTHQVCNRLTRAAATKEQEIRQPGQKPAYFLPGYCCIKRKNLTVW